MDLTGQVCTDSLGGMFYSGIGDQVDFLRGSAMSKGGFSIIALPSTASGGSISRIVPSLGEGAGVATTRGDVNFVITEYGIAELAGKSIYQRVMELAQIAHPKFREELIEVARKRHYIFAGPTAARRPTTSSSSKATRARSASRTARPSNSGRCCPRTSSPTGISFTPCRRKRSISVFSTRCATSPTRSCRSRWASLDYRQNISIIGLVQKGGHKEIVAIGSYAKEDDRRAEVAFVVREDMQGKGVGAYLLGLLERIARENGFTAFAATVLRENASMLKVFKKRYPNCQLRFNSGNEVIVHMDFADASAAPAKPGRILLRRG